MVPKRTPLRDLDDMWEYFISSNQTVTATEKTLLFIMLRIMFICAYEYLKKYRTEE